VTPTILHTGAPASLPGGGGGGAGASQVPFVQLDVQQSAPVVHAPPLGAHGVVQVCEVGSQWPEQQSALVVHVAVCPRHAPGGSPQRPF
jgi:hypothetical protein